MAKLKEILNGYELKRSVDFTKLGNDLDSFFAKEFPNEEVVTPIKDDGCIVYFVGKVTDICDDFKKGTQCALPGIRGACEKGKEKCAVLLGHGVGYKHAIEIEIFNPIKASSACDWPQDRADRLLKTLGSYIEKRE